MKKWLKRIYISLFILIIVILIIVNAGMGTMRFTDNDAKEYFDQKNFVYEINHIPIDGRKVKVVTENLNESDSILLVFVHGAPGTWDAFKDYMTENDINNRVRVISYDRPGYGGSGTEAMPSIASQAKTLKEIVKKYGLKKNILVGHSYGGPIAGYLGLDEEEIIDAVIMIAPLLDPKNEPLHWYSYFSYWKLTSWLLPTELVVAGSEKFAHSSELELMQDKWQDANSSFIHVHGLKDALAPGKENLKFSKHNIPPQYLKTISYDDKGHLIIWTEFELMKNIIFDAIDNL